MGKLEKLWLIGGAVLIAALSSLILVSGVPTPLAPAPMHLVILLWIIWYGYIAIMPCAYIIEFSLMHQKPYLGKTILLATLVMIVLDIIYFLTSWDYGIRYHGARHTKIVALENVIGLAVQLGLAYWGMKKDLKYVQYSANLLLFLLLSFCIFPYLGELP